MTMLRSNTVREKDKIRWTKNILIESLKHTNPDRNILNDMPVVFQWRRLKKTATI